MVKCGKLMCNRRSTAEFESCHMSCTDRLRRWRANLAREIYSHGRHLDSKFHPGQFVSLLRDEKPRILPQFSISSFCDGATWRRRDKVERGCRTTNLFLCPTVSKAFPYSNALTTKSLAQTLPFKSVTDKQTENIEVRATSYLAYDGAYRSWTAETFSYPTYIFRRYRRRWKFGRNALLLEDVREIDVDAVSCTSFMRHIIIIMGNLSYSTQSDGYFFYSIPPLKSRWIAVYKRLHVARSVQSRRLSRQIIPTARETEVHFPTVLAYSVGALSGAVNILWQCVHGRLHVSVHRRNYQNQLQSPTYTRCLRW